MNIQQKPEVFSELFVPDGCFAETVTEVEHYTDRLFRFRTTRPASLRFWSGEFVMIGLPDEKPIYRAYSIASPSWDDTLEFFSIKVPDGPLTSRLQKICPGDQIWIRKKPTGTLVIDALLPGKRLWLFATGTGIAPFASIIRDPESYEKYESIILVHGSRHVAELTYGTQLTTNTLNDPLVGDIARQGLVFVNATTREPYKLHGRVTDLLESGQLEEHAETLFDAETDRAMICGSTAFAADIRALLEARGLSEGSNNRPGDFVVEKAFVG